MVEFALPSNEGAPIVGSLNALGRFDCHLPNHGQCGMIFVKAGSSLPLGPSKVLKTLGQADEPDAAGIMP